MNLIQKYQQVIRFSFFALAYAIYAGLILLKCNHLLASSIPFMIGVILSYFMNNSIMFATKQHNYSLILRYIL